MRVLFFGMIFLVAACIPMQALIIYDGGITETSYNTTPEGMPSYEDFEGNTLATFWNSVVTICQPGQTYDASAVYLGNGYFLTASHVNSVKVEQEIKINGITYTLSTDFGNGGILEVSDLPEIVGSVDLKIFRVLDAPDLPAVKLNLSSNDLNRESYLIGAGRGKGTATTEQGLGWTWGNDSTRQKRWGVSKTDSQAYDISVGNYSGQYILTPFWTGYGNNVAQATLGDSGGGLFQYINGEWVLSGIITNVSRANSAYYYGEDNSGNPDFTMSVRISNYAEAIMTAIAPIPEPKSWLLFAMGIGTIAVFFRKKTLPA